MASNYLLRLLFCVHLGFVVSVTYGAASAGTVWVWQHDAFERYVQSFVISFNCLVSGGLVFGIGLFVFRTQAGIPKLVEATFAPSVLATTDFKKYRRRYASRWEAMAGSASYAVIAFWIFYFCEFPFRGLAQIFMIAFACVQYAVLLYVGRKIYFIAYFFNSLGTIVLTHSILDTKELGRIAGYVNIASTMVVAAVYANAAGYYYGPFVYHSLLGLSARLLLLFMVVAAVPVIIVFNFYPRVVLRGLYERSIELEVEALKARLNRDQLTTAELEAVLIDYDRLKQAELKERLQLTLSDVPIAVAVIVAVVELLWKH